MAGRPLPPPPPVGPKSSPPPPALPKKSASVSQMTGMPAGARFPSSSQRTQMAQPGGVPMPAGLSRRDSNRYPGTGAPPVSSSQYPPQPQYPQSQPQYPQSFPSPNMQQYPVASAQPQYPTNSQYPVGDEWSRGVQSSYMDEMRFAPKVSEY